MNAQENPPAPRPPVAFDPPQSPARKLHWPWFMLALLLPAVLTFTAAATKATGDTSAFCALFGSGASGLICGVLLGRKLGRSTGMMIVLSLVFIVVFAVVSFALCFGGCLAGNYKHDMR